MANHGRVLKDVVHGKLIELEREPGLPEGQRVDVTIEPSEPREPLSPGDGIRRSAGAWADDPAGVDQFLDWNRQERKASRPELGG
jgi:hypothetical protein